MLDDDMNPILIDLGYTTKFMDRSKNHMPPSDTNFFKGNLMFSSVNQMEFKTTSRRDDMISAFYMMITVLNDQ